MTFLIIGIVVITFGLGAVLGAPYVPIFSRDAEPLLDLAEIIPGQTIIDLGSGDGRFLVAAARRGVHGIGYEINPILVILSRLICFRYRRLITIHFGNFWRIALPPSDAIYVFLLDRYMKRLDDKLTHELTRPTKLISFVFEIPGRVATSRNRNAVRYDYSNLIDSNK